MLKKDSRNKSVARARRELRDQQNSRLFTMLLDAVNKQNVLVENLRILLVKRGVFSDAEFSQELIQTEKEWQKSFYEMVKQAIAEGQQQLLRSHKGEPQ